jgi:hypothetical protein
VTYPAFLRRTVLFLLVMGTLAAPGAASAQTASAPAAFAPAVTSASALEAAGVRELIVKRAAGLDARERASVRASVDAVLVRRLPLADTEVVRARRDA